MLRCVARIVGRAACNGEAALVVSRLRSSGHLDPEVLVGVVSHRGSAAGGICHCCKAASIEYCCQVRWC
jgi:hypothetical protein